MHYQLRDEPAPSYRQDWRDRLPGPLSTLARLPWWQFALAVVVAVVLSQQIANPAARVIKAIAGLMLFVVAYRTKPFYALCFIGIAFLFPFSIFIGSSTMIFVVLTATIYLARLVLRQVPPLERTPVDVGMAALVSAYVLSFYNIENDSAVFHQAMVKTFEVMGAFILFYLTANFIRTEKQLRTFVRVLMIMIAAAIFVGMYELILPGQVLIPHWILPASFVGKTRYVTANYRVGGPLYDYELFAEFMAISFFLAFFVYQRARHPNERLFATVVAIMCIFTLLVTVTRGATITFLGGLVYTLWAIRRRLRFRDLVTFALAATMLYLALEFVVSNFTRSGSIIDRLLGTTIHGLVPENRQMWGSTLLRALDHPFVGHGPHFDLGARGGLSGTGLYEYTWPHNQYLYYLHTVGFLGLFSFLFIMGRLLYLSFRAKAVGLREASYPRSLLVVLHTMLLMFAVDQIKIDYLRNPVFQFFPWILMGLIVATLRLIKRQEAGELDEDEGG